MVKAGQGVLYIALYTGFLIQVCAWMQSVLCWNSMFKLLINESMKKRHDLEQEFHFILFQDKTFSGWPSFSDLGLSAPIGKDNVCNSLHGKTLLPKLAILGLIGSKIKISRLNQIASIYWKPRTFSPQQKIAEPKFTALKQTIIKNSMHHYSLLG